MTSTASLSLILVGCYLLPYPVDWLIRYLRTLREDAESRSQYRGADGHE
jgi:hypothetical protein